jgi:hypothetical protein
MTCCKYRKTTFGEMVEKVERQQALHQGSGNVGGPRLLAGAGLGQGRCHGLEQVPASQPIEHLHVQRPVSPFTPTIMDYSSAIANDSGRDPWATSPQHDRSTFNQANNSSHEAPPTNSFHQPPAPDGDDQQDDQNPQLPPQNNQYSSQQHQQQSYDNSTRQEPQRYHHARPQHPPQQYSHNQQPPPQSYQQQQQQQQMQPPQPRKQYKLQAKITALERTGRKDPVLRFDVYVCRNHKTAAQLS